MSLAWLERLKIISHKLRLQTFNTIPTSIIAFSPIHELSIVYYLCVKVQPPSDILLLTVVCITTKRQGHELIFATYAPSVQNIRNENDVAAVAQP
jgi:hypothetical protein